MADLFASTDKFFGDFFSGVKTVTTSVAKSVVSKKDAEGNRIITLAVPGFAPDEVTVSYDVEDKVFNIVADRVLEDGRREHQSATVAIVDAFDGVKAKATVREGLLTIVVPPLSDAGKTETVKIPVNGK